MLAGLPADLQTFLIETSALPVLTGALCDRVTGRTRLAAVLEHLERNQLFTIPIDQRGAYRYHEGAASHLDACLQQRLGAAKQPPTIAGSARCSRSRTGSIGAARLQPSGDWEAVSRLVVHRMAHPSLLGPVSDDAWIELVPAPIVENDPYLLLARARERTVNGRLGAALRDYHRAAVGAAIDTLARTCEEERAVLAGVVGSKRPDPIRMARHAARRGSDAAVLTEACGRLPPPLLIASSPAN